MRIFSSTAARRTTALVATALAVTAASVPAHGAKRPRDLWATVNVCDTQQSPNHVGIRARMPGDGMRERMYMRFTAQYQAGNGRWTTVAGHGASKWLYAGSALFRNEELGWTFAFSPPPPGARYVVRGIVDFQWRKLRRSGGSVVTHRARVATRGGHPTNESQPKGFSAATCALG